MPTEDARQGARPPSARWQGLAVRLRVRVGGGQVKSRAYEANVQRPYGQRCRYLFLLPASRPGNRLESREEGNLTFTFFFPAELQVRILEAHTGASNMAARPCPRVRRATPCTPPPGRVRSYLRRLELVSVVDLRADNKICLPWLPRLVDG
jgi:hypothetical protein